MENRSGIRPLGRAVLVEFYIPEQRASAIVIPESVQDRVNAVEQRAQVVEVGPTCWPEEPPRARAGDHVLISRMCGYACEGPADGRKYRLINDRDIFAGFTAEGIAAMEAKNGR